MNILILGSGGREHTLAWKIAQSPKLNKLFVAPGNAGTAQIAINSAISVTDFTAIKDLVLKEAITLVLVGPEDPLVNGIHDFFLEDEELKNVAVIGPEKLAATLEGSKEFAKEFMSRHNIPTAAYKSFTAATLEEGFSFLDTLNAPYVILNDLQEAKNELKAMLLDAKFGNASTTVVIEEFLDGIELSCFVLTDGKNYKVLPMAKDYKRIGEGDTGLNTGGMGAVSPVPFADDAFIQKIEEHIVKPTVEGLKKDNYRYKGFVFIGLIKVGDDPKVIEYNVRMGDPETEVVIPRIKNDFVEILLAVANQNLDTIALDIDERSAVTIMAVSGGYPEAYEKGKIISGLKNTNESIVFHAGTMPKSEKVKTNGGRVLAITSYGENHKDALATSYKNIKEIDFDGMYYRKDIGFDL